MAVSFAQDIRPLFRPIDVEHMKAYDVLLDDYAYMSNPVRDHSNSQAVEDTLVDQSMPPGGPYWNAQQLSPFKQWRSDGYLP